MVASPLRVGSDRLGSAGGRDYQTNPILRRPAWKFANGKAENEANCGRRQRRRVRLGFSGCYTLRISLMEKVVEVQVCHFVTWLCFGRSDVIWRGQDEQFATRFVRMWDGW